MQYEYIIILNKKIFMAVIGTRGRRMGSPSTSPRQTTSVFRAPERLSSASPYPDTPASTSASLAIVAARPSD